MIIGKNQTEHNHACPSCQNWFLASLPMCRHCPLCATQTNSSGLWRQGTSFQVRGTIPSNYPLQRPASRPGSSGLAWLFPLAGSQSKSYCLWLSLFGLLSLELAAQSLTLLVPQPALDSSNTRNSLGRILHGSPGASLWSHLCPVSPGLSVAGPTVDHVLLYRLPSWLPSTAGYLLLFLSLWALTIFFLPSLG